MPNGFGTVPEQLRDTATRIGDAVSTIVGAQWQGPSGDYGHSGVQQGWAAFIEQMKAHVDTLRSKADGHGEGLVSAAASYLDRESGVGDLLGKAGTALESTIEPVFSGGATGFFHSAIAQRLNPGTAAPGAAESAGGHNGRMVF